MTNGNWLNNCRYHKTYVHKLTHRENNYQCSVMWGNPLVDYITLHSSFFIVAYSKKTSKNHSNNVWVLVPKQVSLQFTSKHWQRWSRCDVFRKTVPDPRASRSKWVVSNSDQPWWTNVKSVERRWPQPALRRNVSDSMQLSDDTSYVI